MQVPCELRAMPDNLGTIDDTEPALPMVQYSHKSLPLTLLSWSLFLWYMGPQKSQPESFEVFVHTAAGGRGHGGICMLGI